MVELDCSLPCSVVGFVPFPQHFFLYVGFNGFSACGFALVFAHGSLNLVFFRSLALLFLDPHSNNARLFLNIRCFVSIFLLFSASWVCTIPNKFFPIPSKSRFQVLLGNHLLLCGSRQLTLEGILLPKQP